jgi:hypothetical protein
MLPTLFAVFLILVVGALLPYVQPRPVFEDDEPEESPRLRMKATRQR